MTTPMTMTNLPNDHSHVPTEENPMVDDIDYDIHQAQQQLRQVVAAGQKKHVRQQLELNDLIEKHICVAKAMQARMFKSMENHKNPPPMYIECIKKIRKPDPPSSNDSENTTTRTKTVSPYVVSLEAQLLRHIHFKVMLEAQHELQSLQCSELVEWTKSILHHIESTIQTMQVKQAYSNLDKETKLLKAKYQETIEHQREAMERFDVAQSDGLDIVAICRHQEHVLVYDTPFYDKKPTVYKNSTASSTQKDFCRLSIRQLFRSSDKPLSIPY